MSADPEQPVPEDLPATEPEPANVESPAAEPSELEAVIAERDNYRDQMLRARAELENVRKRLQREREEERRFAALPIVRDLLPVIDNLERAVAAGEQDHDVNALLQGVRMVIKSIEEVLSRHGVKPIPAKGLPFDPHVHEALQQAPSAEHPPMTVLEDLERGFQIHDRVIRPAKVIVASPPPEQTDTTE